MDLGPLIVFLVVFGSHAIPFIPFPGYAATVAYVTARDDATSMILAVLATGFGAALGKLAVFLYGYGIGKIVMKEELTYAKKFFGKVSKWGVDIAVFIFAMSPLADDVLYIPLGAAGYDVRRFFVALLAGKLMLATAIVVLTDLAKSLLEETVGDIMTSVILAVGTLLITFFVLRIKWSRVLAAYEAGGMREAFKAMLKSMLGK